MPIEIKELHIRVAVNTNESPKSAAAGPAGSLSNGARQAVVAECVEQVLRILDEKRER